jgi:hypothetical protein
MDRNVAKKLLERLIAEASVIAPSIVHFKPDGTYDRDPDKGLDHRRAERWQIEADHVLRDLAHDSSYGLAFSDLHHRHVNAISRLNPTAVNIYRTTQRLVTALELIDSQVARTGTRTSAESAARPVVKPKLDFPEKVTPHWLAQYVPAKYWITAGAIVLGLMGSSFLAGYKLAGVQSFRDIMTAFGLESQSAPSPKSPSPFAPNTPFKH